MRTKLLIYLCLVLTTLLLSFESRAEYGDVIMNNYSEAAGEKPVVFPHWFHRIRYTCKVCHADLGFEFKAGAGEIKMIDLEEGLFCGECHNGEITWGSKECDLCHSGKANMGTHTERSSLQKLLGMKIDERKRQAE